MNARAMVAVDACGSSGELRSEPANVVALLDEALHFRNFRLLPAARILLRDGQPVEIGSRAFDLLHILLRSQGHVVDSNVIMRHVWPTTTVGESNLRSQVSRVRKALGAHRDALKTVPGRGYLLAADVAPAGRRAALAAPTEAEADVLQALLRSVLDELWELRRQIAAERKPPPAEPPRAGAAAAETSGGRDGGGEQIAF